MSVVWEALRGGDRDFTSMGLRRAIVLLSIPMVLEMAMESLIRQLEEAGAAAVMPLGSLIGSNMGLRMRDFIEIIIANAHVPVIIDAGIGRPSQACDAMEMGADAVMAYTAVASAGNIPLMAEAFKHAIDAGRAAHLSGLGKVTEGQAVPSSPTTGYLH